MERLEGSAPDSRTAAPLVRERRLVMSLAGLPEHSELSAGLQLPGRIITLHLGNLSEWLRDQGGQV